MGRLKRPRKPDAEQDGRPGALERRRLRRRLDRQERIREALLLDLGAIIFELHRQSRREPELLEGKAAELRAVDDEVRCLADALEEGHGLPALTARGLVAACTACGGLMGSADRFCPGCGAAAGATAANGSADPGGEIEPPDFGDTQEAAALNGAGSEAAGAASEAKADAAPDDAAAPERGPGAAPAWRGSRTAATGRAPAPSPAAAALAPTLGPRAQRKMRAGRRMARRWLEQRRPDGP